MIKSFSLFALIFLSLTPFSKSNGQVNYSEHIAPIIYEKCTPCHREGEIGPMHFTNYSEVSTWSGMIQYVTEIGYMPPWQPDSEYSHFVGEQQELTSQELQLIKDWVNQGSVQGNPSLEPPLPTFTEGSQLGTPDLVLSMSEVYEISGNNSDDYRVFILPTGLIEDKEIAAIEFRPGNRRAVHHALMASDINGAGKSLDDQTPNIYGYPAFGGYGIPLDTRFIGYTPGIQTIPYPIGVGQILKAGSDLLVQIHYAPLPTDETDLSKVNLFFKKNSDPIQRELKRLSLTPFNLDQGWASFVIKPDEEITFHGSQRVLGSDISLLNVYPHCHYLGKDWKIYAVTTSNDTIPILKIDEWDFNWQGAYTFKNPLKIPSGSTIHAYSTYDNTLDNPYNPSFPPEEVAWGEGSKDEMFLVGLGYVDYNVGDEEIEVSPTLAVHTNDHNIKVNLYPNPAKDKIEIQFSFNKIEKVSFHLYNLEGKKVASLSESKQYAIKKHTLYFDVQFLTAGTYLLKMEGSQQSVSSLTIY